MSAILLRYRLVRSSIHAYIVGNKNAFIGPIYICTLANVKYIFGMYIKAVAPKKNENHAEIAFRPQPPWGANATRVPVPCLLRYWLGPKCACNVAFNLCSCPHARRTHARTHILTVRNGERWRIGGECVRAAGVLNLDRLDQICRSRLTVVTEVSICRPETPAYHAHTRRRSFDPHERRPPRSSETYDNKSEKCAWLIRATTGSRDMIRRLIHGRVLIKEIALTFYVNSPNPIRWQRNRLFIYMGDSNSHL